MAMDNPTRNTMTSLLNPSIVSMSLFIVVDASVGGLSIVEHGILFCSSAMVCDNFGRRIAQKLQKNRAQKNQNTKKCLHCV